MGRERNSKRSPAPFALNPLAPLTTLTLLATLWLVAACASGSSRAASFPAWKPYQNGLATRTTVLTLAVSPDNSQTIYAGAYDANGAYLSTDGAQSWRPLSAGLNGGAVLAYKFVDGHLLAGTTKGLFQLSGDRWERVAALPEAAAYSIAEGPDGSLYVATDAQGLYTSTDRGKTWTRLPGLDGDILSSVAAPDACTILVGTSGHGASVTHDRGGSWLPISALTGDFVPFIALDPRDGKRVYVRSQDGLLGSADGGKTWSKVESLQGRAVNALLFSDDAPTVYAGTATDGILKSDDEGASWQPSGAGLPPAGVLALAQAGPGLLLAGTQAGVYASRDNGASWKAASEGIGWPVVHDLALYPATGHLLAATDDGLYGASTDGQFSRLSGQGLDAPMLSVAFALAQQKVIYAGTSGHGILISRDGGETWDRAGGLFADKLAAPGIAASGADPGTVFARVLFERIYKSTDGGKSWRAVWKGMPNDVQVADMTLVPGNERILFAGTNAGVYVSEDGGESWLPRGLAGESIFTVIPDTAQAGRLLAGATDGLYESRDWGDHWAPLALGGITVSRLAGDPAGILFAGTKYNGVWTSKDGGKSWSEFGLAGESIDSLVVDKGRGWLYAATPHGLFRSETGAARP